MLELEDVNDLVCSRAKCQEVPTHAVVWQNPKIHAGKKHKIWLACAAHCEYLTEFVRARGFLQKVIRVSELGK